MSEWIKVRLTGNLCLKLVGILMMGSCIILCITTLRAGLEERPLGLLLAGLLLLFLLGYALFYWAGSRYLLANPNTKEIKFQQLLRKEKSFSLQELSAIMILKYNIRLQFNDTCYSFQYARENLPWINFLKSNSPLWNTILEPSLDTVPAEGYLTEPEPVLNRHDRLLISSRKLLLTLILLFSFILLLSLTSPVLVIILLCAILTCALLMHLTDLLLFSSSYNSIYNHGVMLEGTISHFSGRNGNKAIPYFTFRTEDGVHNVASLLPMTVPHKEEPYYIGKTYQIWYAPKQASAVLYGRHEPEPLPARCLDIILIMQMTIALVFLVMLFFSSSSIETAAHGFFL